MDVLPMKLCVKADESVVCVSHITRAVFASAGDVAAYCHEAGVERFEAVPVKGRVVGQKGLSAGFVARVLNTAILDEKGRGIAPYRLLFANGVELTSTEAVEFDRFNPFHAYQFRFDEATPGGGCDMPNGSRNYRCSLKNPEAGVGPLTAPFSKGPALPYGVGKGEFLVTVGLNIASVINAETADDWINTNYVCAETPAARIRGSRLFATIEQQRDRIASMIHDPDVMQYLFFRFDNEPVMGSESRRELPAMLSVQQTRSGELARIDAPVIVDLDSGGLLKPSRLPFVLSQEKIVPDLIESATLTVFGEQFFLSLEAVEQQGSLAVDAARISERLSPCRLLAMH